MSDRSPDAGVVADDVGAILGGMHGVQMERAARTPLIPGALQPGYQPPIPAALTPPGGGTMLGGPVMSPGQLPPELGGTVEPSGGLRLPYMRPVPPPQQSPAPWSPDYRPPDPLQPQPAQPQPQVPAPNIDPRINVAPVSGDQVDPKLVRDPTGRNNPGNLRTPGGPGGPGDFQSFPTPEAGIQAMQNQLLTYQDRYGLNTVAGIISRYSPPNENPTAQLIQKAAFRMGVAPNQPLNLHDPQTLNKLTNALLAQEQEGGGAGGGAGSQRAGYRPQQRYIPAEARGQEDWGHPPPMNFRQPGNMPQRQEADGIFGRFAPLLLGIASLALRLPLSTAVTAYGAMAQARQNGQDQAYERNRTKYQDQLKEATAQQTLESGEARDAFAEYGHNNPQGLQQQLAQVALKYNDPIMFQLAERGDLNGIYRLQQQRDMANQNLVKSHAALQEERDRQAQDADAEARDRQYLQAHPDATPEELAIEHAKNLGLAQQDFAGPGKAGANTGVEAPLYNVLGPDGQPTGRQVQRTKQGSLLDTNGQPTQLQPGERLQPVSTKEHPEGGGMEGPVYDVIGPDGKPTGAQVRAGKDGGLFDISTMKPVQLGPGEHVQQAPREGANQPGAGEMEGPVYDVMKDGKPTGKQVRAGKRGGIYDVATNQPTQLEPGETIKQSARESSAAPNQQGQQIYDVIGADQKPTGQQVRLGRGGGMFDVKSGEPVTLGDSEHVRPINRQPQPLPAAQIAENWQGAPYQAPPGVDAGLWQQAISWAQQGRPPVGLGGRSSSMYQSVEPLVPAAMKALGIQSLADQSLEYDAKRHRMNSIETSFGGGMNGRNLVSLNTVADHIGLFRQYAEALRNGDIQRLNQLRNRLGTEAGSPEVIDFALASRITGDEVVRLLTTTGGTLTDREDIANRLASYNSPEQFENAANTLTNYVRGRYAPLRQAYARGDPERERYFDQNMVTPEARALFQAPQRPIPGNENQPAGQGASGGTGTGLPPGVTVEVH